MRLWPKHWHPETWICSLRGHVAPAMWASVVGPGDENLDIELPGGQRLARCLRCDCWVPHAAPNAMIAKFDRVPSIAELSKPRRGNALRQAIIMRLIALNKATHALGFTLIALLLATVRTNLFRLQDAAQRTLDALEQQMDQTGQQHGQSWLQSQLEHLLKLKSSALAVLFAVAVAYAVLEWLEAIGLWFEKRWAEYLTVLTTSGFLPLEIRELLHRVTVLRSEAFVVNVALVAWLLYTKRLFGLRGGHAELVRDDQIDWPTVLANPRPAEGRLKP